MNSQFGLLTFAGIRSFLVTILIHPEKHVVSFFVLLIQLSLNSPIPERLQLHTYTTGEGMLSNNIKFLHQGRNGNLWIGSSEGLTVYDGIEFFSFSARDGLPYTEVYDIAEDSAGTIWVATLTGLRRYAGSRFEIVWPDTLEQDRNFVHAVMVDPSGTVWFASARGVFRMHETITRIDEIGLPTNTHFACGGRDLVWIVERNHVWRYSITHDTLSTGGTIPAENGHVRSILAGGDSVLWVLTSGGTLLKIAGFVIAGRRRDVVNDPMFLLDDREGYFWIGGNNGLAQISQSHFVTAPVMRYGVTSGLPQNFVLSGLVDREGSLWFGTHKEGLTRLVARHLRSIAVPFQYRKHNNMGACSDDAGHIWTSAHNEVFEIFQDNERRWHQETHVLEGGTHAVRTLLLDRHGRLWVDFVDGDLICYSRHRSGHGKTRLIRLFSLGSLFPAGERFAITFDSEDNLWVSIMKRGVGKIDIRTRTLTEFFTEKEARQITSVRAILVDRNANIWMGDFSHGLTVASRQSDGTMMFRHYSQSDGLPDDAIRALHEASDGSIWIGTRYGGVSVYRDSVFHPISIAEGLRSNAIWCFTEDRRGNVWCGSFAGIQPVNLRTLTPETFAHGLTDLGVANCGFLPEEILWGISADRILLYENGADSLEQVAPLIRLSKLFVNEHAVPLSGPLELSHDQNNVRIEFTGVSFREEKGVRYVFRLKGLEQRWRTPTPQREVTYANLDPGSYEFEARAVNADGLESLETASFSFTITPPFWEWPWLQLVFVLAVATLTGGIVRWRSTEHLRAEARRREFQRKLVSLQESERKRIASGLHDSLGQNLLILKNLLEQHRHQQGGAHAMETLSELAQQSLDEVREVAFDLHPHVLDRLGLRKAIETVVEKISHACPTRIRTGFTNLPEQIPDHTAIGLYRITQEALSNIVKHSGASSALVRLESQGEELHLSITDDGAGFDAREYLTRPPELWSLGLLNIAERVRLLGGVYSIESAPGKGTTLQVQVPRDGHDD